jgi:hypothetical protein
MDLCTFEVLEEYGMLVSFQVPQVCRREWESTYEVLAEVSGASLLIVSSSDVKVDTDGRGLSMGLVLLHIHQAVAPNRVSPSTQRNEKERRALFSRSRRAKGRTEATVRPLGSVDFLNTGPDEGAAVARHRAVYNNPST